MADRLASFARRVSDDRFFLASALRDFARSEGLDEAGLAAFLDCRVEALPAIRLCRRPVPASFREDIGHIAERFSLDDAALAEAVRRADVLAALRNAAAESALAAARDREDGE